MVMLLLSVLLIIFLKNLYFHKHFCQSHCPEVHAYAFEPKCVCVYACICAFKSLLSGICKHLRQCYRLGMLSARDGDDDYCTLLTEYETTASVIAPEHVIYVVDIVIKISRLKLQSGLTFNNIRRLVLSYFFRALLKLL